MITQGDMDKILVDVNRVLAGMGVRLDALEELTKKEIPVKTTTSPKTAVKPK